MPVNQHWIVMADDTGDPGEAGMKYFGYVALAVERRDMSRLIQIMSEFRVRHAMYDESRVRVKSVRLRDLVGEIAQASEDGALFVGSCMVIKEHYEGAYLRGTNGRPADPHFFRNYVVRHTLETLFQGVPFTDDDSIEVVLDRVDYSDRQILNLRDYLNSELAKEGDFLFPKPRWVTHADSNYVEGLQVADHLAALANALAMGRANADLIACASRFLGIKTLLRSRPFTIDPTVESAMGRHARERLEEERKS